LLRKLSPLLLLGCGVEPSPPADTTRPWSSELPAATLDGATARRTIVHLHSPWSHDACDNQGLVDGVVNASCLQDLVAGLCANRIDDAYLTDHPSEASYQEFEQRFHPSLPGEWVRDGAHVARDVPCDNGHTVRMHAGFEDELMPVGMASALPGSIEARHELANGYEASTVESMRAAGADVFVAHSEQRDLADLQRLVAGGLAGMEVFNMHAAFSPEHRAQFLGLDPNGWIEALPAYRAAQVEPDLLFLTALDHQRVSLDLWDALLADGPMVGVGGSDAHQNVMPLPFTDGERVDSYRRSLRWMTNWVVADASELPATRAALAAGRVWTVFEVLGTPAGLSFSLADGTPMGGTGAAGVLEVGCPGLHPESPQGGEPPVIDVRVLRDGVLWETGCGSFDAEPGVYRLEVEITPHHLAQWLPEGAVKAYPWLYSNAIRVDGSL